MSLSRRRRGGVMRSGEDLASPPGYRGHLAGWTPGGVIRSGQTAWGRVSPSTIACKIARPLLPKVLLATLASMFTAFLRLLR